MNSLHKTFKIKSKKLIVGITAEGSVNLLHGQLAHFKSLGYQTYLLAPYSERSSSFCKNEGCEHLIINIEREISPDKDLKSLLQIIKIFRKIKPDIINLGTPKVSLLGMLAGRIVGVEKRIYTCRGFRFENEKGLKRKILIAMEKTTAFFAHHIICISPSLKEYAVDNNIFPKNKTIVINKGSSNGLEIEKFSKKNIDLTQLKRFKEENNLLDKFIFGFVGRLVKDKGIFELLNAFENLNKTNKNIHLIVLGSDITASKLEIENLKKYKSNPNILFLGYRNNVDFFISLFDVLVLPTYREGFGNVFIQAAALGVPCIGTDITGCKDAVNDGYNGILVPPKDVESLKQAMEKLLLDKNLLRQLGENGITWSKHFERTIIWNGMERLYES